MSVHHTESQPLAHLCAHVQDSWETEVVPTLPPDLDAQAHALHAFQRIRGIRCPSDLLRALLAFVLFGMSTRHWGALGLVNALTVRRASGVPRPHAQTDSSRRPAHRQTHSVA
jgi:hypothetical protein